MNKHQGNAAVYAIIAIVVLAGFFLTGGLFNYKYTNQQTPGTFVPLTPPPDTSQKSIQFHSFRFLYLTPTPTPNSISGTGGTHKVVWLDSGARSEYNNDLEWLVWSWSSCSGDSMAMVFNAYGKHLNIGDVLETEYNLGVWTPSLGILGDYGFTKTGDYYGFNTSISYSRTLQQIIDLANSGTPVIVGAPMHILVLTGGDSQYVYLADPSPHNYKRLTRNQFQYGGFDGFSSYWTGLSIVMTPK